MPKESVALLVDVPRALRTRIRVAAAQREETLGRFVQRALESALVLAQEDNVSVEE